MTGEQFESHVLFEKIEQFKNQINEEKFRELFSIDDLNFFETAYDYLLDRLKLTIPIIVQDKELTTISQEIENALTQINTFAGNKNAGHVKNAQNHIHSALTRVRNLPLPFSKNDFNFSKNIAKFEKTVQEKNNQLVEENNGLSELLKGLRAELNTTKTELQKISTLLEQKEKEIQMQRIL